MTPQERTIGSRGQVRLLDGDGWEFQTDCQESGRRDSPPPEKSRALGSKGFYGVRITPQINITRTVSTMSTTVFDFRKDAKIHALKAGFSSLSEVARILDINRSRLDDLLTGRSPCSPETVEQLSSTLQWPELPQLLAANVRPSRRRFARTTERTQYPLTPLDTTSNILHDQVNQEHGIVAPGSRPNSITIRYPGDLPPGVPLWAVVVIEQARGLGKRPIAEDPTIPECWALVAARIIEALTPELNQDYVRKRIACSGKEQPQTEPSDPQSEQ